MRKLCIYTSAIVMMSMRTLVFHFLRNGFSFMYFIVKGLAFHVVLQCIPNYYSFSVMFVMSCSVLPTDK